MTKALAVYAALILALTCAEYRQKFKLQVWLKPLSAIGFILIAILGGAIYWEFGRWILWGLLACAIGDVLLLSRNSPAKFKLGMLAFAIGHILYALAFLRHPEFGAVKWWMLIPVLAGLAYFVWIRPKLPKDMVVPVGIYSTIIIVMVILSLAVSVWMVPLAAIMFAASDMFVARDRFVKNEGANALAITPLYFGAQALFALAAAI